MTRIAILPYGPSDSCTALRDALIAAFSDSNEVTVRKLRSDNSSVFRGRPDDIIINYGNRSAPAERFGNARVLNPISALNNAANKLSALNAMRRNNVSTIPFTTNREEALVWAASGHTVYARTTLTGHSGEGIVVVNADNIASMPEAPLYTRGITGRRREWRVHVFNGSITHVQVKRRRNGYAEDPNYREDVRNHQTGWIYATENINPSQAVLRNAVNAVACMGLDFGAVDVISFGDDAWVLEVNTAPGLQAETTMTAFVNALTAHIHNIRFPNAPQMVVPFAFSVMPEEEPTPDEVVAEEGDLLASHEAPREEPASPLTAGSNVGRPQEVQRTANEVLPVHGNGSVNVADGYYLADIRRVDDRSNAMNVIVWIANGQVYRHGWNSPISPRSVHNVRPISSVMANDVVVSVSL